MQPAIAVIGAGLMGAGVARTLIREGHGVTAYDVSRVALDRIRQDGAITADSIPGAVENAAYVLLSLPGPAQVRETIHSIIQVRDSAAPLTIIDISTIDPATSIEMANTCDSVGAAYVEAPVSGGPRGAENGTLAIMVGCREETFADIKPLLEELGSNIYYLGSTGTASLVKLCNNAVVAATAAILGEAFLLASAGGISSDQLAAVLSKSVGASGTLDVFGKHIIEGDYSSPTFSLGLMHKDLDLFMQTARHYGITTLLGSLTFQLYDGAHHQGWDKEDHTVVCRLLETLNQSKIRSRGPQVEVTT